MSCQSLNTNKLILIIISLFCLFVFDWPNQIKLSQTNRTKPKQFLLNQINFDLPIQTTPNFNKN